MTSLRDIVSSSSQKIKASRDSLRQIWFPEPPSALETYLRHSTKNPYIANILVTIATNEFLSNGNSGITVHDATEKIETKGIEGVIELIGYVNAADVWSGGGARGNYHVGAYETYVNIGLKTKFHLGVSIGSFPALFFAFRMRGSDSPIDTSTKKVKEFAYALAESLGLRYLSQEPQGLQEKITRPFKKAASAKNVVLNEGLLGWKKISNFLQGQFGNLKLEDAVNFYTITCDYRKKGNNRILLSGKNYPNELVVSALKKTIAAPYLFVPVRENRGVYGDGGLVEVFPCGAAIRECGADLVIGILLNYHIPEIEPKFGGRFGLGKISQGERNFAIMNRATTYWMMLHLTNEEPGEVARNGDPRGRILLNMPDLSNVRHDDFYGEGPKLIEPGKNETMVFLSKFLSPNFKHPKYDPSHFLQQYKNGTTNY